MASDDREQPENTPDGAASKLSEQQRAEVVEQHRPAAPVLHEVARLEGLEELERPPTALFFSGLASGLSMGFSMVAMGLLQAGLPDTPWRHLLTSLGYPLGYVIVVLGRQELFTESTLAPVLPLLTRPSWDTFWHLLRLWAIVLASNLLGAYLFALAAAHTPVFSPEARQAFLSLGLASMHGSFWATATRGIFAGWLIALMAWLLPSVVESRLWIIALLTYAIGLCEFSHVIAGSVLTMFAVSSGALSWKAYWTGFMLPALLGNTVGGVGLVAMLNHAQVAPGRR